MFIAFKVKKKTTFVTTIILGVTHKVTLTILNCAPQPTAFLPIFVLLYLFVCVCYSIGEGDGN